MSFALERVSFASTFKHAIESFRCMNLLLYHESLDRVEILECLVKTEAERKLGKLLSLTIPLSHNL